jgi:hypothetical protein
MSTVFTVNICGVKFVGDLGQARSPYVKGEKTLLTLRCYVGEF